MSAEYKIASLADFVKIPPEKLDACLIDFAAWLRLFRVEAEINSAATRMLGGAAKLSSESFTWVDDGIVGSSAFDVVCDGEVLARVPVGGT
jgi:hypothetical protein